MSTTARHYDVIIVGAGMVGTAMAIALAQQGLSIALLNNSTPQLEWETNGYDSRVSAITRVSQNLFKQLGAWDGMESLRVSPYTDMHVWDASGKGKIHFDAADIGEPDIGHIIENRVILKALHLQWEKLTTGLSSSYWPASATHLVQEKDKISLTLDNAESLTAKLIIGADGGRSWIRKAAGISIKGWDYDHTAVVTTVKTELPHQHTAWQRFLPTGPLAFLPLTAGMSSIVWSTSASHAKRLLDMEDERFAIELQTGIENTLGKIEYVAPRAAFPLRFFEAEHYAAQRLALMGDAAHIVHPLAGQGVNLGLADVASMNHIIHEAISQGRDIGSVTTLRKYERTRRADNRVTLIAMDGLKRLFSDEHATLQMARNQGMSLLDKLTPLKNMIIQQAMGTTRYE
jgi:2-octaprenylphenol hydroxylase